MLRAGLCSFRTFFWNPFGCFSGPPGPPGICFVSWCNSFLHASKIYWGSTLKNGVSNSPAVSEWNKLLPPPAEIMFLSHAASRVCYLFLLNEKSNAQRKQEDLLRFSTRIDGCSMFMPPRAAFFGTAGESDESSANIRQLFRFIARTCRESTNASFLQPRSFIRTGSYNFPKGGDERHRVLGRRFLPPHQFSLCLYEMIDSEFAICLCWPSPLLPDVPIIRLYLESWCWRLWVRFSLRTLHNTAHLRLQTL